MFRQLLKNKKAQNTAEYALLIALVIAGVIAMQTYAQRSLQAKMRDAGKYMTSSTNAIGSTAQYEPYYQQSNYDVNTEAESNKRLAAGTVAADSATNRTRAAGGYQATTYSSNVASGGTEAMPSGI